MTTITLRTISKTIYLVRNVRTKQSLLTDHPCAGYEILAVWSMRGDLTETGETWTVDRQFGGDHTLENLESAFRSHLASPCDGLDVSPVEMLGSLDFDSDEAEESYRQSQRRVVFTIN
jgi:hypothetical protein